MASLGTLAKASIGPSHGVRRDARRRKRAEVRLPVRLWPFEPRFRHLQEVRRAENFTREGLYFTTSLTHYAVGMRMLATFPFCPQATLRDYLGVVVRVERQKNGMLGVALRFIY